VTAPRTRARPAATAALVAVGIACEFVPRVADALRFERERIQSGEIWRFLTGHLVHGSSALAVLDLAVLVGLGAWWEHRSRAAFVAIVLTSATFASTGVLVLTDLAVYVGSSAITAGLFTAGAVELGVERPGFRRLVCAAALVLFALKCAVEAQGGAVLATLPTGTRVCFEAHALGGVAGVLVAITRAVRARRGEVST